ncbi:MAG: hypothetical protein IKI77_11410 [Oscillospiraceae bacterium]|nr:hypothetical protein [Oscillospiraceae bacterium]
MRMHDPDPDELAALLDSLVSAGTQHINLEIGAETRVQTVNSTECSKPGACAIPNMLFDEDEQNGGIHNGK